MNNDDLEELKSRVAEAERRHLLLKGKVDSYMERLRERHGVSTLKQAREKLRKYKAEIEREEALLSKKLRRFKSKWKSYLSE